MSKLQDFLNENDTNEIIEEVPISDRFKDKETGELLKFRIKNVSNSDYKAFQKSCMKITKNGSDFDYTTFNEKIVIAGTIDPNFKDAESIKAKGCGVSPEQYLNKVLLAGEIMTLAGKILELSGFKDMNELREEAKN